MAKTQATVSEAKSRGKNLGFFHLGGALAAISNISFAERYLPLSLIAALGSPEEIEQLPLYPIEPSHVFDLPRVLGRQWTIYRGLDAQRIPFLYVEIPRLYPLIYHPRRGRKEPKQRGWEISSFSPTDTSTLRVAEAHLHNLSEFMSKVSLDGHVKVSGAIRG